MTHAAAAGSGLAVAAVLGCGSDADPAGPSPSPRQLTTATARPTTPRQPTPSPQPETVVIVNGTLIDGTGSEPLPSAWVITQGERIAGSGSGEIEVPAGALVVDAQGGTILPGLVDPHVHITRQLTRAQPRNIVNQDGLRPWLEAGITTLREVGTARLVFPSIRIFSDGLTLNHRAPRVVWAGPMVTAPGGYPTPVGFDYVAQEVATVEEARNAVGTLADGGAGVIKLGLERGYTRDEGWPLLTLEQVTAITRTAHARGLRVTAHVTDTVEVRLALDGEVDDLAHAPLEPIPEDMMHEMREKGMGMATTATVWGVPDGPRQAAANAKLYADAGGTVSVATDFGCGRCEQTPGAATYLRELDSLAAAGMTSMQLIVAATRNGAIVSNMGDELGTIERGKLADIIVVDGDPLVDIGALGAIAVVMQGGTVVKATSLR